MSHDVPSARRAQAVRADDEIPVADRPPRTVAVVTGSRAEYGLLRPVLRAIAGEPGLRLQVVAAGAHLLPPANTIEEVRAEFPVAATVPMQTPGRTGRLADAAAFGHGASGFAAAFADLAPDVVLVLGDRIEAFAAAAAASIGGIRLAHIHGGDRAEGVADEAMRHAITKLAHIHFPASARSAERILCFGEDPLRVHLVGSPAVDGIADIPPLDDKAYDALGRPEIVMLLHGQGRTAHEEGVDAEILIQAVRHAGRPLLLHPNHDPGHDSIVAAIAASGCANVPHLRREAFIGLLRRVRLLVGNSSSALIECAALGVRCVNVGPRQAGREKPPNVFDVPDWDPRKISLAIERALVLPLPSYRHPYGNGHAGERIAQILATFEEAHHPLAKRATF
ncbi:MAG: UDP-N-acetylglucosamine 2-epimerase (hydrolyzing) [Phycisphaerales bacterium]|nr:UDP-N-acetylglucosamine 2-epimerase (hydrolyzing) [Phycisphaerales bacterium]